MALEDAIDTIGAYSHLNPAWIAEKKAQGIPDMPTPKWIKAKSVVPLCFVPYLFSHVNLLKHLAPPFPCARAAALYLSVAKYSCEPLGSAFIVFLPGVQPAGHTSPFFSTNSAGGKGAGVGGK